MEIYGYDFEVLSKINWWCVTFINKNNLDEKIVIVNDRDALIDFYQLHKNDVYVGYNSRHYDQYIYKGILLDMNVGNINDRIVIHGEKGYNIVKNSNKIKLINYDVSIKDKSLKQLEGFMGNSIVESKVPFDIDTPLTQEQIDEMLYYNEYDVLNTLKILELNIDDFNAHFDMISMFNLDLDEFNKTKSQLGAFILGAVKQDTLDDEFDITYPKNLILPEKYKFIYDWYNKPENKSYKLPLKSNSSNSSNSVRQLCTNISDVPCVFGYGGLHGSKDNQVFEGIIVTADVESLYPSLMINENYTSRKLKNPDSFKDMKNRRIELKKIGDKRQLPLKIVINGSYGILKDIHSACFDPVQSNNVCIAGQLYLTDLAAKLEDNVDILQINTDGIYFKIKDLKELSEVDNIMKEWENRTNLKLDVQVYKNGKLIQKDVNNYILIDMDTKKYKSKGAYVKKLSPLDYDLPILNKALINYFVYDIPVETTINEETKLIEFQKIIKLTSLYNEVVYGIGEKVKINGKEKIIVNDGICLKEKVHRVFASKRNNDKGIYKVKFEKGIKHYEKIAYTPDKCFIYNDDVKNLDVPNHLDKDYYIKMAKERLSQFTEREHIKIDNTPKILYECMLKSNNFYLFLENCKTHKVTNRTLTDYITANCCNVYGKTYKLLKFKEYFDIIYNKNKIKVEWLKSKILDENIRNIIINNSNITNSKKYYINVNYEKVLSEIFDIIQNKDIDYLHIIEKQLSKFNEIRYKDETIDKNLWFVLNIRNIISPNIIIYNLNNGEIKYIKVSKFIFNILPILDGDVIQINKIEKINAKKIIGKNDKGINIIVDDKLKQVEVITNYNIISRNYKNSNSLVDYEESVYDTITND